MGGWLSGLKRHLAKAVTGFGPSLGSNPSLPVAASFPRSDPDLSGASGEGNEPGCEAAFT
jgi:hypothetical protein